MQAKAAVAVRPELADVGFFQATLTNHSLDWVFYNEPFLGTMAVTGLGALLGTVLFTDFAWAFLEFGTEVAE